MTSQNIWSLPQSEIYRQKRRAQTTAFYLDPRPTDTVLDVGCGEGFIASHLLKANFVVSLDTSKDSLLIAKQKVSKSNVDFVHADATQLPLKNALIR